MLNNSKIFIFTTKHIHLLILGIASFVSIFGLYLITHFDMSKLSTFGPTARTYFWGIKNGLVISSTILLISFIASLFFINKIKEITSVLILFFQRQDIWKKNIFILIICIVFSFISHAGNISNGYFNMDDFETIGLNHTLPFSQAILNPHGNDHTIPLFITEAKIIDSIFGQNPIPYNLFVLILFALIPFFVFLTLKKLGVSTGNFFVFLVLFSGATSWADMLTGFYIMSIYPQILLYFSIATWSYLSWYNSKANKYIVYFSISILFALASDISGIWVIPGILMFIGTIHWMRDEYPSIKKDFLLRLIRDNKVPLLSLIVITLSFAGFLYYTFAVIQPNTFLSSLSAENMSDISKVNNKSENWKPLPLATNFFTFITTGVSLPLIAPNIVKILAHPSINFKIKHFWPIIEVIILIINIVIFAYIFKLAKNKNKKLLIILLGLILLTTAMVVFARPNHELIPDFDYRYAGAPFYFYVILITLGSTVFLQTKKEWGVKIIIPFLIILFSAQQAFSFHSFRLMEEAKLRSTAIINFKQDLISELNILGKNIQLTIPNLSGSYIFQPMPGFALSQYLAFFDNKAPINLIQNKYMPQEIRTGSVTQVSSLRDSTSKEFIDALKNSKKIGSYYATSSLMTYQIIDQEPSKHVYKSGDILIRRDSFDPEKIHTLKLGLSTSNISGNLEISFSFKNDFTNKDILGKIRIDDYTPFTTQNGRRLYNIETDLLQIYTYALSNKVSDLTINIPETKNTILEKIDFK